MIAANERGVKAAGYSRQGFTFRDPRGLSSREFGSSFIDAPVFVGNSVYAPATL